MNRLYALLSMSFLVSFSLFASQPPKKCEKRNYAQIVGGKMPVIAHVPAGMAYKLPQAPAKNPVTKGQHGGVSVVVTQTQAANGQ